MGLGVDCLNRTFTEVSEMRYEIPFLMSCSFGFKCFHSGIVYMSSEKMERGKKKLNVVNENGVRIQKNKKTARASKLLL